MQFQYEWRGQSLQSTGFLVCQRCLDIPFIQNRPLILPPDPVPIENPRFENFNLDNNGPTLINWDQFLALWDSEANTWDSSQ